MADPPHPDTLQLDPKVRTDISMRMYADGQMGKRGDWTAFASHIGMFYISMLTLVMVSGVIFDPAAPKRVIFF